MTTHPPRKILIVLLGAIGDVAQGLTLAKRIKDSWPEAHLSWAVEPPSRAIVEASSAVDRVFVFDRPRGFSAYREFVSMLRKERFDLVLDLQRHLKSGVTTWLTRAPRRIGFHRTNAKEANWLFQTESIPAQENFSPKIQQYHAFGDLLGLARPVELEHGVHLSSDTLTKVEELITRVSAENGAVPPPPAARAVLVIGARWESKRWPPAHFGRLASLLHERLGMTALLVGGGESDRALAAEVVRHSQGAPVLSLIGQTSLVELVALASQARVVIGNDSGPLHLAAAAKVPIISLFGATHPGRSAPYGSEALALHSPAGCSPCYRRRCPGLNTVCMLDLPPEAVLAQVEGIVQRR